MVEIDLRDFCNAATCWNTEILACKIAKHRDEKILLDLTPEGWDIIENGIDQALKNICDELGKDYKDIEILTVDKLAKSKTFSTQVCNKVNWWSRIFHNVNSIVPSDTYNYGMFFSRASRERLYSIWKHFNWQYTSQGIVSMRFDPMSVPEWKSTFTDFVCEHNEKWQDLIHLLPYSDLDEQWLSNFNREFDNSDRASRDKNSNINAHNGIQAWNDKLWQNHYKRIAIEIVSETNTTSDSFFITEKTFRPLAYGKLFLIIGSPEFETNLKKLGFDTFDDIIDKSYDTHCGDYRVEGVFNSLAKLLENPIDMNSLNQRLEANRQRVLAL